MAALTLSVEAYRDRVLGAWQGRSAGITLGAPQRGQLVPGRFNFYNPVPGQPAASPATDFPLVWLDTLEQTGSQIVPEDLAVAWLEHLDYAADEFGYAALNLRRGLPPPASGDHGNWFHDGAGAIARADLWALVAPGAPQIAAELAYHDAKLDHSEEGLWATMALAAIGSASFFLSDNLTLLAIGLAMIPRTCRTARAIKTALAAAQRGATWLEARESVQHEVGSKNFSDAPQNVGFLTIGMLYGNRDFGSSLCAAVNCGYDSESVGAALGALLGIRIGASRLPADWTKPVRDIVISGPGLRDFDPPDSLSEVADRTVEIGRKIVAARCTDVAIGEPAQPDRLMDPEPGPPPSAPPTPAAAPADLASPREQVSAAPADFASPPPPVSAETSDAPAPDLSGDDAATLRMSLHRPGAPPASEAAPSLPASAPPAVPVFPSSPDASSAPRPVMGAPVPDAGQADSGAPAGGLEAADPAPAAPMDATAQEIPAQGLSGLGVLRPQGVSEAAGDAAPEASPEPAPSAPMPAPEPDLTSAIAWADNTRVKPLLVTPPGAQYMTADAMQVVLDPGDGPTIGLGQQKQVSFSILNTGQAPFSGRIDLLAPAGWLISRTTAAGTRQYVAANGGTNRSDFTIRVPEGQGRVEIANTIVLRMTAENGEPVDAEFLLLGASCWWTVGPFANFDGEGFDRSYAPEDKPGQFESYLTRLGQMASWERQLYPEPTLDLEPLFRGSSGVCYGKTLLRSPAAMDARLVANTNSGVKLWLNGALVFRRFDRQVFRPQIGAGPWAADVKLQAGDNSVMVKWVRGSEPYAFSLTVADRSGRGIHEIGNTAW
jgi:ADP-ribosylglycohydrolase